jgi:hypothetical protein
MRLQQAIFTSVRGSRLEGYQIAAQSAGVSEALAKELTAWGPAHDSLWDTRHDARSVNYHPLESGDYCLSCTRLAGAEYSSRSGNRVYTQMFVLPTALLARFANDPFLVLRALAAAGRLVVFDEVPPSLPSVPVLGHCDHLDGSLLSPVLEEVGQCVVDDLVNAIDQSPSVAVVTSGHVERLFQALLYSFSIERRLTISFTTGLKPCPRRPFQLVVLPNNPTIVRQFQRTASAKIIELAAEPAAR